MDTTKLREAEDRLRQFWQRQAEAKRLAQRQRSMAQTLYPHLRSSAAERGPGPKGRK